MSELHEEESEFARRVAGAPFDDGPRAAHRDGLRERALAAFDPRERSSAALFPWKRAFNQGRELMRRPMARYFAVAAACLAVVAAWMLVPRRQSTAHAFNVFAEAIVNAKSASFLMDVDIEGQPKKEFKAYYLAPGKYRNEWQGTVGIVDFSAGKSVTLIPQQKLAVVMNMKGLDQDPKKRQTMDAFGRLRELLAASRDAKDNEYQSLGEKEIDGHRALGFRHAHALGVISMWGDPRTGMPLFVETTYSGFPTTKSTMRDFQLNVALKPELFDMKVPADYKVQQLDVDTSKFAERDLVEAFRRISELSGGEFLDALDTASMSKVMIKYVVAASTKDKGDDATLELMKKSVTIGRGISFALKLPEAAEAHYAGKGVKLGEPERPIFWYKPEGSKKYRVIYADLTVKDADRAPEVPGAVRLEKPGDAKKPVGK
jgi:outer membrane lipoprotein-sorting protein